MAGGDGSDGARPGERGGEVAPEVVLRVVGQDRFDGDRMVIEELLGAFPKPRAGRALLVGEDLAEREAAVRIDRSVGVVVANFGFRMVHNVFAPVCSPPTTGWDPTPVSSRRRARARRADRCGSDGSPGRSAGPSTRADSTRGGTTRGAPSMRAHPRRSRSEQARACDVAATAGSVPRCALASDADSGAVAKTDH